MIKRRKIHSIIVYGLCTISFVLAIIAIMVNSEIQENKIENLQNQVKKYEETLDKVEEEVGLIDDLKYQIEGYDIQLVSKMNELDDLNKQIEEKKQELENLQ